jgi:hypothetical protein
MIKHLKYIIYLHAKVKNHEQNYGKIQYYIQNLFTLRIWKII